MICCFYSTCVERAYPQTRLTAPKRTSKELELQSSELTKYSFVKTSFHPAHQWLHRHLSVLHDRQGHTSLAACSHNCLGPRAVSNAKKCSCWEQFLEQEHPAAVPLPLQALRFCAVQQWSAWIVVTAAGGCKKTNFCASPHAKCLDLITSLFGKLQIWISTGKKIPQ